MIKTQFNEIFKTKYPIVQAGMGPYSTEKLCIAAAQSGALGLISTVGIESCLDFIIESSLFLLISRHIVNYSTC